MEENVYVPKSISFTFKQVQFLRNESNASLLIRRLLDEYIDGIEGFAGRLERLYELRELKTRELEELEKQIEGFELKRKQALTEKEKERKERVRRYLE